jgi:hypothetical protein
VMNDNIRICGSAGKCRLTDTNPFLHPCVQSSTLKMEIPASHTKRFHISGYRAGTACTVNKSPTLLAASFYITE